MKVSTLIILSTVLLFGIVSVYCERSDHQCGRYVGNPSCSTDRCCSIHGWCGSSASYCRGGNCDYQCWAIFLSRSDDQQRNNIDNNNNAVSKIISESIFNKMFKHRKDCPSQGFYSYDAFVTAAGSFPAFCNTGDLATRKRELAAFLAQTSLATTGWESDSSDPYAWGYCHINTTTNGVAENDYCTSSSWPCASGKKYNSRGPIQLTHNYNYGIVGEALRIDLINDPDLVATNAVVSFKTAIWFWMTQHNNKPSCHDVLIDANFEANQVPNYGPIGNMINHNSGQERNAIVTNSIGYFKKYCDMLEVSYGDNLKYWFDKVTPFSDVSLIQMPVY